MKQIKFFIQAIIYQIRKARAIHKAKNMAWKYKRKFYVSRSGYKLFIIDPTNLKHLNIQLKMVGKKKIKYEDLMKSVIYKTK